MKKQQLKTYNNFDGKFFSGHSNLAHKTNSALEITFFPFLLLFVNGIHPWKFYWNENNSPSSM